MAGFTNATLMLTDTCNLNCKYCFERGNKKGSFMTKDTAEKTVDFLINEAIENNKPNINLTYFGGEPTLNIEVMNHVLNYAIKRTKENKLIHGATLITNGVLYNDEYEKFLTNWWDSCPDGFHIQLSFDSIPEINDLQRVDVAGRGSSHDIVESMKKMRELFTKIGIPSRNLSVHSVITKITLPYVYQAYRFFKDDMKFDRIWFMPLHEDDWDDNDYVIFREQYTKIANDIINECKANNNKSYKQFSSMNYIDKYSDKGCSAGVSYCCVNTNGDIYPCHAFIFDPDTKIGSLSEGIDKLKCIQYEELYRKYMTGYKACSECNNHNCKSCIAINYMYNGNIAYGFPKYCKLLEIERELSIYVYEKLFGKLTKPDDTPTIILQEIGILLTDNFTEGQIKTLQHLLELHELLLTEKISKMVNERECTCHDRDTNSN